MIFSINFIVMSSSFLMACFVKYNTKIVNHHLCLDSMPFLLSRIIFLFSFIIYRPWNLLFCAIYKGYKSRKVFFNFIESP